MIVKFRLRRDTAANWTAANPVLALGEPGVETDTRFIKYGDGVTAWNALPYAAVESAAKLTTARTINGVPFDGTANISFNSDAVAEGLTNLYFLNSRARGAVSSGAAPALTYNVSTGVFDLSTNLKDWSGKTPPAGATIPDATNPTDVAFSAGNFTASGSMTWTVAGGNVVALVYAIVGKVMTVWFNIQATTVGGTLARYLYIAIPAGKTARNQVYDVYHYYEGSAWKRGFVSVDGSGGVVRLEREDNSNWQATSGATYALGQISFPIN